MEDRIYFTFLGLHLQEPMALVFNWMIAVLCFYSYVKTSHSTNNFAQYWRLFFLFFGISTAFGGVGHLFFQYLGWEGKFPAWIFGSIAVLMSSLAMLEVETMSKNKKQLWVFILLLKSATAISLSLIYVNFMFIAIDAAIGYLFFCMGYGIVLIKRGFNINNTVWGVLVLLPSIIFFVGKISAGKWLNEQDIGHIFMIGAVYFFYLGVKSFSSQSLLAKVQNEKSASSSRHALKQV